MNQSIEKTRSTRTGTTSESASSTRGQAASTQLRSLPASQRSAAASKTSAVLVRILFQYLERVDKEALDLAKEVLKDCKRKHDNRDSKFATLAEAVNERVRNAVGESHWAQACQIQGQLVFNQRKKRVTMALKLQGEKNHAEQSSTNKKSTKRSLVNADISVPRRNQLRRVKKRKKSRSPSSSRSGEGSSENSDSSYTSTSSLTTSGNEKGSSTSSTAPSTSSTNPSTRDSDNTPRESSSCSSGD